ncbi:c-type cytochrome [bacterium]|nr:c-type cytochrome [bacterium]
MSPANHMKNLTSFTKRIDKLALALLTVPVLVAMTACTGEMNVDVRKDSLAARDATHSADLVLMPDSRPSVGDGSVYWKQANCASCHGDAGKGVPGKCDVDLTDIEMMRGRKPIEQYEAIAFGKGVITKMPVLSEEGKVENMDPQVVREFTHPRFADKFDRRVLWNLVFYSRSLAVPLLSEKEHAAITAVFGANCAVCHGTKGAGDGPLNKGLVLQPAPANFNQFNRFYDRTDEQIWDHIANGIKWEGMPNFLGKEDRKNGVKFDADYIWKLVQYVRNFHEMPDFELEQPPKGAAAPAATETKTETKDSSAVEAEKPAAPAETDPTTSSETKEAPAAH